MAKTALLNEIEDSSLELNRRLQILYHTIEEQSNEPNPQIKVLERLLDEAIPVRVKMNAAVKKMDEKIKSWDGSVKLKNIFKNKKQLESDRQWAQKAFKALKKDVDELNTLFEKTAKFYEMLAAIHN